MALSVKNSPAVQEMQVQSLVQEGPLKKETATHSSILAWEIPGTEEPGRLQSMGWQRVGHNSATKPPPPVLFNTLKDWKTFSLVLLFSKQLTSAS